MLPTDQTALDLQDCWNRIGVFGDRSCPLLDNSVHCRNCHVYSAAGRSLLERQPPDEYLSEWTSVLAEAKRSTSRSLLSTDGSALRSQQSMSLMILRLEDEFFALPVAHLLEVSPPYAIHSVPHRSTALFLGLVNIRGEIILAGSLTALLGLTPRRLPATSPLTARRMAVASASDGKWVFPIDEIFGIYLFDRKDVKQAPVVISQAASSYSCGVFQWQNRTVALLDPDVIFPALTAEVARL